MVGPQPARYRLAVGSGQKSGRVGLRFYDPSAPLFLYKFMVRTIEHA